MGLKVAVVEDDPITRFAITSAIVASDCKLAFEAENAADAALLNVINDIDVAILDLHLGNGPTGLDVAYAMRVKNPLVGLVFLTNFADPRLLSPGLPELPRGAQYLTKASITKIQAIVDVVRVAANVKSKPTDQHAKESVSNLSTSQMETLRLVAQGLTNAEIARRRFVTEKAVEASIVRLAKCIGLSKNPTHNQRVNMAKVYFRGAGNINSIDEWLKLGS
jgi:DNA-binding NarL/FixJ family response regulator